eukprot:jgi/Galph1/873/GphlegSOOS_G5685.1
MGFVTEESVFIQRFVTNQGGFSAIIKHLHSDFIVNEIDVKGNILRLDKSALNKPPDEKKLEKWFDSDMIKRIHRFVLNTKDTLETEEQVEEETELILNPPIQDKEERRQIHKIFHSFDNVTTETVTKEGLSSICIQLLSSQPSNKRARIRDPNASDKKFLSFLLCKRNADMSYVISKLSKLLHIRTGRFSFAGTKDKRAITTQEVRVSGISAERMWQVAHNYFGQSSLIRIGRIRYCNEPLHLGELAGNRFTVVLRDVINPNNNHISQSYIEEAIEQVKQKGFINYFGLQRFGSGEIPSHQVGFEILRGNYEKANHLILTPYDPHLKSAVAAERLGETSYSVESRKDKLQVMDYLEQYRQGKLSAEQIYSLLPNFMSTERQLLKTYMRNGPRDHKGAFCSLPRSLRKMYVHAVQSYLWNAMATARMHPSNDLLYAMAGDLVFEPEPQKDINSKPSVNEEEPTICDDTDFEDTIEDEDLNNTFLSAKNIKAVSHEVVQEKKYSIHQVVLPLVGSQVQWPENEVRQVAARILEDEGQIDFEALPRISQEFQFRGGYRPLIAIPRDVQYEFVHTKDRNEPLTTTEEEIFSSTGKSFSENNKTTETTEGSIALVLQFTLRPSEYATMLLRELTKQDSSSIQQLVLEHQSKQHCTS